VRCCYPRRAFDEDPTHLMHLHDFHRTPHICGDCRKPPGAGGWLTLTCEVCRANISMCPREGCFQGTPLEVMQAHYKRHRHGLFQEASVTPIAKPVATCSSCGHDLSDSYHQCHLCDDVIYCCTTCDGPKFQTLVDDHQRLVHYTNAMVMGYTRRFILDETGVLYAIVNSGRAIEAPAWVQWILVNMDSELWRPALRAAAKAVNPIGAARAVRAVAQTGGSVPRRRPNGTSIASSVIPLPAKPDPTIRHAYNGRPNWAQSTTVACEERFEAYDRALDEVVIELPREPMNWYFHMRIGDGEAPEWTSSDEASDDLPDRNELFEAQWGATHRRRKRRLLLTARVKARRRVMSCP